MKTLGSQLLVVDVLRNQNQLCKQGNILGKHAFDINFINRTRFSNYKSRLFYKTNRNISKPVKLISDGKIKDDIFSTKDSEHVMELLKTKGNITIPVTALGKERWKWESKRDLLDLHNVNLETTASKMEATTKEDIVTVFGEAWKEILQTEEDSSLNKTYTIIKWSGPTDIKCNERIIDISNSADNDDNSNLQQYLTN